MGGMTFELTIMAMEQRGRTLVGILEEAGEPWVEGTA